MQNLNITSKSIKYEDDLLIYREVNKDYLEEGLKEVAEDLICISNSYQDNGLSINFDKTSFMILKNSSNDTAPDTLSLNCVAKIAKVKEKKYLGIIFDENLNFKMQFETLIDKLRLIESS
ncbi:hypothetical protein ACKWTF_002203 [Chironomus riparius]